MVPPPSIRISRNILLFVRPLEKGLRWENNLETPKVLHQEGARTAEGGRKG